MHNGYVLLAALILNVVAFLYLKPWRQLITFLPLFMLAVVVAAEMRDRLVAWRVL